MTSIPRQFSSILIVAALGSLLNTGCAIRNKTQIALGRNASIAGIEAKGFVGKPIDAAVRRYGPAERVVTGNSIPKGTIKHGVDLSGKELWIFVRDKTHYTVDEAVGSEVGIDNQGPVIYQYYERQDKVAICRVTLVVDPVSRLVLTHEVLGNCL